MKNLEEDCNKIKTVNYNELIIPYYFESDEKEEYEKKDDELIAMSMSTGTKSTDPSKKTKKRRKNKKTKVDVVENEEVTFFKNLLEKNSVPKAFVYKIIPKLECSSLNSSFSLTDETSKEKIRVNAIK